MKYLVSQTSFAISVDNYINERYGNTKFCFEGSDLYNMVGSIKYFRSDTVLIASTC